MAAVGERSGVSGLMRPMVASEVRDTDNERPYSRNDETEHQGNRDDWCTEQRDDPGADVEDDSHDRSPDEGSGSGEAGRGSSLRTGCAVRQRADRAGGRPFPGDKDLLQNT